MDRKSLEKKGFFWGWGKAAILFSGLTHLEKDNDVGQGEASEESVQVGL